jgi:hypothetical protein
MVDIQLINPPSYSGNSHGSREAQHSPVRDVHLQIEHRSKQAYTYMFRGSTVSSHGPYENGGYIKCYLGFIKC